LLLGAISLGYKQFKPKRVSTGSANITLGSETSKDTSLWARESIFR